MCKSHSLLCIMCKKKKKMCRSLKTYNYYFLFSLNDLVGCVRLSNRIFRSHEQVGSFIYGNSIQCMINTRQAYVYTFKARLRSYFNILIEIKKY